MSGSPTLRYLAALLATAALGAAAAVGAVSLLGGFDETTTVVTETVVEPQVTGATPRSSGMSINEIYEQAAPGVVQITATSGSTSVDPFSGQSSALGSGFIVDKAGHIVTNYHVIRGGNKVHVSFSNRDTVVADLVGTDPSTDLAVLKVETEASALTPLSLGDSDAVRVGDPVVAIGNPVGLDRTATAGIVSALQRFIRAPNDFTIDHVIQTDAPINTGNSGGPLLNAKGEVIGVNTQIETGNTGGGNVGIGFAVPSNTVKDVEYGRDAKLSSIEAIADTVLRLGEVVGETPRASELVTAMQDELVRIDSLVKGYDEPTVLYYASGGLVAGSDTTVGST